MVEIAGKKHLLFRERRQAHDEDRPFFNVVDFEVYDLFKFYNKPYEYWLSQQKEMPFFSEESFLRNLGLEKLLLFSLNEDGILSSNKLKLAEESLKHILSTYCKQKNNLTFRLIEYIYSQERDHKLYFFYYYGSFNLKIAVFNIRENEWIIVDYNELECEIA